MIYVEEKQNESKSSKNTHTHTAQGFIFSEVSSSVCELWRRSGCATLKVQHDLCRNMLEFCKPDFEHHSKWDIRADEDTSC